MRQKKLMLLGGLRYLLPVIDAAHDQGYHVITVDYLPDNIAHKYSDEYHNVSILDKDAVLNLAQDLQIDGIMSFAVDPGVITAAYVAEKMGLPFQCSYRSACILQNKALFRNFLAENGFNTPLARGYNTPEEAFSDLAAYRWPIIVKPVDSAGSKGVTKVVSEEGLADAIRHAIEESHSNRFIIEEFLEKVGESSDTDSFSVDGKLVFCSFSDQLFDRNAANPYTPAAYIWPSTMPPQTCVELHLELQRLFNLLGMKTGIYNIETRLATDGKPYIMEVSPRGGGNRLAEMLDISTGSKLIENSVRAAMGDDIIPMTMPEYDGYLAEVILHADSDGTFDELIISDILNPYVIEIDLWVNKGEPVYGFTGANNAIGTLVMKFPSRKVFESILDGMDSLINIKIEK